MRPARFSMPRTSWQFSNLMILHLKWRPQSNCSMMPYYQTILKLDFLRIYGV
jgi:hypothetical protein